MSKKEEKNPKLTLNRRKPNSARRRMHQHNITSLDARPHHQRAVARRRRHKQARGIAERPALGHRQQRNLLGAQLRGKRSLRSPEDARAHGEARLRAALARRRHDGAGEFGAGYPWEGWQTRLAWGSWIRLFGGTHAAGSDTAPGPAGYRRNWPPRREPQ